MGDARIVGSLDASLRAGGWTAALVLAGLAGWLGPTARGGEPPPSFEQALEAPPAEQRKLLRSLAVAGDVRAAARMIDLAMWDEMKDVPVGTPPIDAWLKAAGDFGGMTTAQVHGCIEANWAARQTSMTEEGRLARIRTARDRMMATEIRSPALAMEVASWLRDFEPRDAAKADTIELGALPSLEKPAESLDVLVRATRLAGAALVRSRPKSRAFDIGRAAELAGESASLFAAAKDGFAEAGSLALEARCRQPDNNPKGDWTRAAALHERATAISVAAGDKAGQASSLYHQARCLEPERNKAGSWKTAIDLYERATAAYAEVGDKKWQAICLHCLGWCLYPRTNPAGDWKRAAAYFERAAALRAETGDKSAQGSSLEGQATCLHPDMNPAGDWELSAALSARAAALYDETGEKSDQSGALYDQAYCTIHGDRKRMTSEVRRPFAMAVRLAQEAGDQGKARRAQEWIE